MDFNNIFSNKRKRRHEKEFKYNTLNDPAYQAYKEAYERQASGEMSNTLGKLSTMTGGVPSSYAVSAASQNYAKTMSKLYDKVPQLVDAAYSRYNSDRRAGLEEEKLDAQYARDDYSRYKDSRDFEYTKSRDKKKDEEWQKNYFREVGNDKFKNNLALKKQKLDENAFNFEKWNSNRKNALSERKQALDEEKFNFQRESSDKKNSFEKDKYDYQKNAFDYKKVASMAEDFFKSDNPEKWLSENAKYLTAEEYMWILKAEKERYE